MFAILNFKTNDDAGDQLLSDNIVSGLVNLM